MKGLLLVIVLATLLIVPTTRSGTYSSPDDTIKMPDQSYVGMWYGQKGAAPDELIILEINDDTIRFCLSLFRITTIYATAKIEDSEIKFVQDDIEAPIKGRLVFHKNSISVIIDESWFEYIDAGTVYGFPYRE